MNNEKKQINIVISDLDDLQSVLSAMGNLCQTILLYYLDNDKMEEFTVFAESCRGYFDMILKGIEKDDDEGVPNEF
jgi:hypothetical protein